eukprot:TRINITY_DN13215_c0_g1_i4.p1 TRINITY_DN13215_c0_g1~~TRINITY_DN13215_c0_g1_i4.p1  ORF type:complete len:220 (-),score=41.86 TRINITY_DN13215_c0_g1_i4:295-954(-)
MHPDTGREAAPNLAIWCCRTSSTMKLDSASLRPGHWADSERKEAQSEEQLITSVFPPLSPYEVQEFTRIRCSVCSEYIAADAVEEHSRRCVSLANECCSPATGGGLVELSKSDPAWSSIVDLLQASSMENIARYRYSLRLTKLWKVRPSSILQEHASEGAKLGKPTQLFFGASLSDAEGIALEGFKLPETAGLLAAFSAPCDHEALGNFQERVRAYAVM